MDYYRQIRREYRSSRGNYTRLFQTILSVAGEIGLEAALECLERCVIEKRLAWLDRHLAALERSGDSLADAYRIFYEDYLGVSTAKDGEVVEATEGKLVTRWWNECPTLEVCKELGLDTREICKKVYHRPVQVFLSRIDSRLRFDRNYDALRPHVPYCEEVITLEDMGQDLDKVEYLYDTVAKEYAEAFSDEHAKKPKDREMLRRFSQEIGDRRPVWDFGCGPGQTTKYLKDLGVEISGLDLSEKIVEQARTIHPGIHFRKGNILELEFENGSIAGIVAFYAIVHFTKEQVGLAFREIFRVLEPDGLFLFTYHIGGETIHVDEFLGKEIDIDFMFFSTDFIVSCLEDSGFETIEIIEREPYPGVEYESQRAYVFARKPNV